MGVSKSRGWLTIVYPESTNFEFWTDMLARMGQQCIISPLHDQDINQGTENERKKPHYHVLLLWDGPTTEKNARKIVDLIGGVGCFPAMSIRGCVRYFCHLDNPDKAQYRKEDLKQIGGLDLESLLVSESDEDFMLKEIFEYIRKYNFLIYADFVDYCSLNKPEWFNLIMHKHRENVFRYLRSIEYGEKDQRKPTKSDQEVPGKE